MKVHGKHGKARKKQGLRRIFVFTLRVKVQDFCHGFFP
jgi:hypothetical protein